MKRFFFKNFALLSFILILVNNQSVNATIKPVTKLDKNYPITSTIYGGSEKAVKGGTLTYEAYEPNHINPITYRQAGAIEVLNNWLFETLVTTDIVTGDDIPLIARKWRISADGKTFTFWIDKRAKWFDGRPITAEDVKFSFEVYKMDGVKSATRKSQTKAFSKIEILGKRIIRFTAKDRLFSNYEFLISTLILPKHLYYYTTPKKMERNQYTKLPRGSGPYIIESWNRGNSAVLKKNTNYWGHVLPQNKGAYNFDKIVIKYIRDPQIAFEKLKKGELDYMPIRIGNSSLWRQTKTDKAFTSGKIIPLAVKSKIQSGYGFIGFNLNNELFKDRKVRVALALAVNRQEMIRKSLDGLANIPWGPLYSIDNSPKNVVPTKFNPGRAYEMLASLGWSDSDGDYILDKNGRKFEFTVLVPNARIEKEMLFVQNYWKEIGVKAHIKILEYSTWRQLQDERKFDAISNGKSRAQKTRNVDPYSEWHSDNIPRGLKNYYGLNNSNIDQLIEKGRKEFDIHKRKSIFDQVNNYIANEHIMLQYSESKYSLHAVNSKIALPSFQGNKWYPYSFGKKYWYRKSK